MFSSGYVRSITFGVPSFEPKESGKLPEVVDLSPELDSPIDQGADGICVSVCMTDILTLLFKASGRKYRKQKEFFYKHRSDKKVDGMSPRNAFEIAQANGLVTAFATLKSVASLRVSILANGPILIALPVYDFSSHFWQKPSEQAKPEGYHATTFVGYDDIRREFKLRNSWGVTWAELGYTYFPYTDTGYIMEAWTAFK